MQKKHFIALVACAVATFCAAALYAQTWQDLQTSTDEATLIQAIEKPGDAPEDIHTKNVACKRLAVYGTPKAIPALVAMLSNDKQNFNARFALEAMPFDEVDVALRDSATKLEGANLVGVIDTLGVRGKADSFATIKATLDKATDPVLQKACFAALGMLATADAEKELLANVGKDLAPFARQGLGDALLDCAEHNASNACYDAVMNNEAFPKFQRDAALYRSLLLNGANSADKVVALINGDDASARDVAFKTLREFKPEDGAAVVKAVLNAFDSMTLDRQILVVRAFPRMNYKDALSAVNSKAEQIGQHSDSIDLLVALAKAAKEGASIGNPISVLIPVEKLKQSAELRELFADVQALYWKDSAIEFDPTKFSAAFDEDEDILLMNLKWMKDGRVKGAAPKLVEIAEKGSGPARDAALEALSEIIDLDDLDLFVKALNGETDDQKVDWLLRAACTRLPREDCAAKVADIFEKADLEQKNKILPLLKQIGGPVALKAVADACNGPAVDKATQILGEWNTPEDAEGVADVCLAIAKQAQDAKYHSRGIRGYIRVARQFDLPVAKKIEMCKTAFDVAKRPEDKALIFEVFKRNIVAENVAAALEYAQYPEFKDAACEAAVFVAEKIRTSQPAWKWTEKSGDAAKDAAAQILVDGMKKVVETTSNADLKARAQKLL